MAKNLNLNDQNVVTELISNIEGSEERGRKTNEFRSWQIYSGNVKPYVKDAIIATRPKSYTGYTFSDISFSKMITDTKSKAYKEAPLRSVDNDDVKNERLNVIYEEGDARRQMPYLDTITNLHKHSLLWVNYIDESERYNFMSLQGYEYSVVRDKDTGDLIGVILNYGNRDITSGSNSGDGLDALIAESQADSSAGAKIYAMWSEKDFVVIKVEEDNIIGEDGRPTAKKSVTYVDIPGNPHNENKIGVLPFVYTSQEMAIDFPTPSPLSDQTITANAMLSEYMTATNIQGTGQLVVSYPQKLEGMFKKMTTGLLSAIKLPQSSNPDDKETKVDYINPNPDLAGQKETTLTYIKQVMNEHGIKNTSSVDSSASSFSSGLHMAIANASVQDIIEENQLMYVEVEKQMFTIIKAWESFLGNSVFKDEDQLNITFKKPKVLISDKEVLENVEKRLALGLIEKYEALMILDPNLNEKSAKEKADSMMQTKLDSVKGLDFGTEEDNKES